MAMLPRTADVVIVGGGVHGASLAYHLARKRAGQVVLLERAHLASGPTARSTALVRRFYGLDFFTRTASAAADVFQRWGDLIGGDPGFRQVGFLVLAGPEEAVPLERNVHRARRIGARVELLSAADVMALVPGIDARDVVRASYEAESGYADPVSTTTALATRASDLGARIVQNTVVRRLLVDHDRVIGVDTVSGIVHAPLVVNCAGLGAARLLTPLGIDVEIRPTRHQMCVFRRPAALAEHPAIADRPNQTYMRPETGDLTLFGLGSHVREEIVDPDRYDEHADPEQVVRNAELLARRFPQMEDGLARGGYAGLYDTTPDRQPVLGAVPEYRGLYVDFGWSGHGFKHGPVIGALLADLILIGSCGEYDLRPFRWSRFRDGDLVPDASPVALSPTEDARSEVK